MQFAVNYSEPLVRLLEKKLVEVDRIKCPAWPDLIDKALHLRPCYVHLPLTLGNGLEDALNSETNQPVDWAFIESVMKKTDTPMVNLHLTPYKINHPALSEDVTDRDSFQQVLEAASKELEAVVRRCGKENVLVENSFPDTRSVPVAVLPELIKTLVESCDVGFLYDVSHGRLAARKLGIPEMSYVMALPVERTAEIHITGIRKIEGQYAEKLLQNRPKDFDIEDYLGKEIDHQSLTESDFAFLDKILFLIAEGRIRAPWIASMEHGGVGPFWELSLDEKTLSVQVPELYNRAHSIA